MAKVKDPNKPTRVDRLRQIQAGCKKHSSGTMVLAGRTFKMPDDLVNEIQGDIDATDAVTLAHGDWMSKVALMRNSHKDIDPLLSLYKRRVESEVGNDQASQAALADYGWTPPKKRKVTIETKTAAVSKAAETRKMRNTMGSNQKKKVKAGLPQPAPVVVEPAVAPVISTSAIAPAAPAAPAGNGNGSPTPKP